MSAGNECVQSNGTDACPVPGSPAGLAAGLTLLFLSLLVIAGVLLYKYHHKIWTLGQLGQRRSQEQEERSVDAAQHAGVMVEEPAGLTPVYENLGGGYKRPQSRSPDRSEEDLYLQCHPVDDEIYMNGPGYGSNIPGCQDEDLYVLPESEDAYAE